MTQDKLSPDPQEIARRAFEIYEAHGRLDGRDVDDWLEAETELAEQEATQALEVKGEDATVDTLNPSETRP